MRTCRTAFEGGYTNVKLYFMMGLPTETDEDIKGIIELAQRVVDLFIQFPTDQKERAFRYLSVLQRLCLSPLLRLSLNLRQQEKK